MAYGFIAHIKSKGYSDETVKSYEKVLKQFFGFIQYKYPGNKEAYQISSKDIRDYLENQKEREKSISTLNKELAILKSLFNYLWEIDKVPVDPAVKIKRFVVNELPSIEIPYEEICLLLEKVLKNPDYSPTRKAIFLFAAKGLKTSDYRFKKEDVTESKSNGNITIKLHNRIIQLDGEQADVFREYFYESMFNSSDFVFITKKKGDSSPIEVMSILNHLRAIARDYLGDQQNLTLISIRRAIAYNLYTNNAPIQKIAKTLGIEEESASYYVKQLMEGQMAQNNPWRGKIY